MSFQVFDALASGIQRTVAKNGLMLVAAFYVMLVTQSLFMPYGAAVDDPSPMIGETLLGALVSTVASLVLVYLTIVAIRTFVTDETETIPDAALRDRPVWAFINMFVGIIVFTVLVVIGTVLFIFPGIFLLVTLWFFYAYVAAENDGFVTAMRRSWSLTSGNRLRLFAVGFVVVMISLAISASFAIPNVLIGGIGGVLISQIGSAFSGVFTYATTATAFNQLRDEPGTGDEQAYTDDWGSTDDQQGTPGVP